MKNISKIPKKNSIKTIALTKYHDFTQEEVTSVRQQLLQWYGRNKRDLPWRKQDSTEDANKRAYSVWVSEIMLQQTQVVTVIDYYNRWMKKWPTVQDLARADIEEVNQVWSGLGYYSRARRLHEAANKVMHKLKGQIPRSATDLHQHLPGVGRYTASAVASISFKEPVGVVDGNVVRVLSRLRAIGANSDDPQVVDTFWQLSDKLVSPDQPGDFNQGIMELGATVCTPKSPACSSCPLQNICHAYKMKMKNEQLAGNTLLRRTKKDDVVDIECVAQDCHLCLPSSQPWESSLGVTNFPRKSKKKPPREQTSAVFIIRRNSAEGPEFLMNQRPKTGLLAGLWEFPTFDVSDIENNKTLFSKLEDFGLQASLLGKRLKIGDVIHIFSHIHQTYCVEVIDYTSKSTSDHCPVGTAVVRWMTAKELQTSAISTAMRKVFKRFEDSQKKTSSPHKKPSTKHKIAGDERQTKRQRSLMDSFFKSSSTPTTK
ncbi:adenine DNA glycosylase-like [Octopus sinensis]|uniref:Adenine DNA glycosylase n=1 Tax=Octopus sinensis TaxID=2607531 RepID=A0A7E6FL44_9MOLL|nr:adenine DNA glycosylase-like [Octopus sinensis]